MVIETWLEQMLRGHEQDKHGPLREARGRPAQPGPGWLCPEELTVNQTQKLGAGAAEELDRRPPRLRDRHLWSAEASLLTRC